MESQIREKNRVQLIKAAFRVKFHREPRLEEMSHWLEIFHVDGNFERLLTKLTDAVSDGTQHLSVPITRTPPPISMNINPLPTYVPTKKLMGRELGVRGSFFYGLLQSTGHHSTTKEHT